MPQTTELHSVALPDGGKVHCTVRRGASSDVPLLLLPSVGGGSGYWGRFGQRLEGEHAIVAIDPRGFGESSAPPPWFSTRRMAEDVVRVLDALHIRKVDVFGISFGGVIAAWLAIDAADRVDRLVLASTVAMRPALSPRRVRELQRLARCFGSSRPKPCLGENIVAPDAGAKIPETLDKVADVRPRSRYALFRLALATVIGSPFDELGRVRAPTLLLFGDKDPVVSAKERNAVLEHMPHAELRVISDVGHDLVIEAPDVTADCVLRFLRAGKTHRSGRVEQPEQKSRGGDEWHAER